MASLVGLLALSNVFMTLAWFLHLRHPEWPLIKAVLISWLIAVIEYAIAIPAVRMAHDKGVSAATIKVTQEAVTFIVFGVVAGLILSRAGLNARFVIAGLLVCAAVLLASRG